MLETLKYTGATVGGLILVLIALGVGTIIVAGLAVAAAVMAVVYRRRVPSFLRPHPRAVVIEAEYYEVRPQDARR